ncbi:MAG: phosphate acyltransferase PlsX [Clostridia bacterium]|nr:phosphate acyltransferase PlsX [Clostridia bacterium]
MKIAVDAMGGDNAPFEIVKGAYIASEHCKSNKDIEIVLLGDKVKILSCFSEISDNISNNISIIHTDVVITMDDDPMMVMKEKNNSSMAIGLKMLKNGEVDAFISAGSTGALHAASTLIVRKIKGVRRSAIASILPFSRPILLLDSGANPTVTADILNQWAVIGSAYVNEMLGVEQPKVGLLNNGTEEHKGTPVVQEAYNLLKNNEYINFVGNIESREIPNSPCDVLITDGFTGNITLKLAEGMGAFFFSTLKNVYTSNTKTKISYLLVKDQLKGLKKTFSSSSYGGAPLLGISKPVIKAHGSCKAENIFSAILQAINYSSSNIINRVQESLK